MSTLIIKSKIWNLSQNKTINYKEKKFHKQKLSIDHSAIIYRQQDKIFMKKVDDVNISHTSNDNTNFMFEKNDELISVSKVQDNKYIINCGNWSKDLTKLINENAAFFIYKGLTIENLLKEKQKYYVLNQGDILKLGKTYLKLLHINLSNDNNEASQVNEIKKSEGENNNNSVKEEVKEDDNGDKKGNNNIIILEEERKDNDGEENEKKENEKENGKILLTYTNEDSKLIHRMKTDQKKNRPKKNNNINMNLDKNNNYSFSYIPKNYKNINLYIKQINKEKNSKLNRSFNGRIPILNANNLVKESININRPKSPRNSKIKYFKILKQFESNNINKSSTYPKNNVKIPTKLVKKISNFKLSSINKNDESNRQSYRSMNKSDSIQYQGKICRICFIPEEDQKNNPLLCPCLCKGSMKYIHYLCLKNWLNLKVESELGNLRNTYQDQPTITYSTNDISCELCKTKLPDYIRHKGKIYNVSFYKPKYDKFMVFESIRDDINRTKFIHIIPLVKKNLIKIGRLNTCDLSLPDISVSRVHCCVYIEGEQLFMENNSKYGTRVLIQNSNLTMSASFPLCIEVQNTYLKLMLKKSFSLFDCCGVNTTTISKMLVYQEQNEKGFDIFCSMVIKDDDDKEEQKEDNSEPNIANNLPNDRINNNSNININKEEDKKNENDNKINNESFNNIDNNNINNNNLINSNKKGELNELNCLEDKSNKEINKELFKNENVNMQEYNKLINDINHNSKEEKEIKCIKIIKEDSDIRKYSYKTEEQGECNNFNNLMNDSEIKSRSNIYNKLNRSTQKLNKDLNEKVFTNLKKEKFKNKEIVKTIKKELIKDNNEIINLDLDNNKTNTNNEIKLNSNNNLEHIKNNKIYKKNIEDQLREELNIKENNIIDKFEDNIIGNNEIKDDSKFELEKVKFSQKRVINQKLKNKNSQINSSINLKETKSEKTISCHKEETNKNIINLNQKDINLIKQKPQEKINGAIDSKAINEDSKLNKGIKKQKKLQNNTIDLKEINELSYGKIENSCNINYSPIDSYQAIFGLSLKNTNKGSSMLAPKHKNINFLKLDLNSENENNINSYPSNLLKNRYTYQYEEDKKSKNNK